MTVAPGGHVCLDRPGVEQFSADAAAARGRLRVGTGPVTAVVVCDSTGSERVPGKGEWQVRTERTALSGVQELVAALRLPDVSPDGGHACLAYADGVPELWVVDDTGRAVLARWPVDDCGHLRVEAKRALSALTWRDTGKRRLEQVVPQAALDVGCEVAVKEIAAIEGTSPDGRPRTGSFDALDGATSARMCIYRVTDPTPQGTFERGAKLRGRPLARLLTQLKRTPPAPAGCRTPSTRFAELLLGEKGLVAVELDGCRRILTPDEGLRQATAEVLAALAAPR